MLRRSERNLENIPVGALGLIPITGCEEYGKEAHFLKAVQTAPFYAFEYVPSCWSTNGGVKVDSHLRAVDKNNKAIPGLYVAGVDQGSVYSVPYYTNEGSSVGLALGAGAYVADEILGA